MKKLILLFSLIAILALSTLGFADTVQIGTGTATTSYLPIYGFYGYNYTQQIYLQTQINKSGNITKLRFFYVSGAITNSKDWVIYMGHTTKTSFSSTTDWVPLANLTQVFAGDVSSYLPAANNWMEIPLTTPFNYNNTDNLVIAVDENTSGYASMSWGAFTSGANTGIYYYNDSTNPDPASPPPANSTTSTINRIQLVFPNTSAPLAPTLLAPANGSWAFTNDVLSWVPTIGAGDANAYDVYLGTSSNPPLVSSNQTTTTYTPTLAAGTTYYWKVVAKNEFGDSPASEVWSFKTPITSQLAESFENTTFPPAGWANPGTWSRSTTYAKHGTASAYKYGSTTTQSILSTPKVTITSTSTLDFWALCSLTTGTLQIVYSPDRTTWTQVGSNITFAAATTWYHNVIDLSSLAGNNYYLGFRTGLQSASFYVDAVFGPEITPEAPGAPTLTAPADLSTNVNEYTTFTWTAPTTGGVPTGYKLYCDTNNPPTTLIVDQSALSYTLTTPLAYNTTYYWTVSAYNAIGEGPQATVRSFTTREDPTIYTFPWLEDFGTTGTIFPPNNWSKLKYLYGGTPASGGSWVQDDWLNTATGNKAAKLNIYGTGVKDWLITPPIQIPATGYELKFDLALMDYGNNDPVIVGGQPDDRFIVAISNNPDMTSSTILREWNNTGSTYVYDNIPNTGTTCNIVLSDYAGTKYIAFYGESTVSNGDNDLMVDNVTIRAIPTGPVLYCTPTSLDFGEVAFGVQVGPKKVTVTNTGSGVLALNKADNTQIVGTGFAIDDFDFSLEANESGQINVYANATQEGPFTATLRITYGTQQCVVSLSATGLPEGIIVIGTGDEDLGLPIKPNYGYSYSQSIFLQSDIHLANRNIEKIYYYWNGAGEASYSNEWTVYMGNTDKNEFVDEDDWIPIGNLTQVFSGVVDLPAVEGWVEINLASPFYHNNQNIVIAVDENESGYDSYNDYFYGTSVETKGNRSILYRSDGTNPDPALPPTGTYYNYAITGYPNIKLEFEEAQPPLPVELTTFTAVISSDNLVEISWVTQTETGMVGYYVYRSSSESLDNAIAVSDMIEALNTPEQHTYKFIDSEIYDSGNYYYWLQTVDLAGSVSFHGPVSVYYTSAEDNPIPEIPKVTELRSIYPNPFNPVAFIPYSLAEESDAHFYIYNVKGQLLRHIYVGPQYPGYYQIRWDGKDINGKSCGSGVYYIIMKAGKQTFQRKAVLMK